MSNSTNNDGYFHCAHCKHVVSPSPGEIEAALSSPSGQLAGLKCPGCHKLAVSWHPPSPRRVKPASEPVTRERGLELFEQLKSIVT